MTATEHAGVGAFERDDRQTVRGRIDFVLGDEAVVDVGAAHVHADLPGGERLVDRAPFEQEVRTHRVVLPAHRLEELEGGDRARVVDRHVDAVGGLLLEAATEGVAERRQHPPAGVVLRHLGEAGLTGRLGDRRCGLTHLGPRRRRGVGVETGLLEHRPVVVQADAVGGDRHAEDGAVGVLGDGEHVGVEVGGVRQGLDLGGDVGHLAALDADPGCR